MMAASTARVTAALTCLLIAGCSLVGPSRHPSPSAPPAPPAAPRTGLVINIAAMRIFYYPPLGRDARPVVLTHPIGIGKVGWRTPEGVTKIVRRQQDPTWRVPVSVRKEHHENGEDLDPVIG